jgi:hypothetical protein
MTTMAADPQRYAEQLAAAVLIGHLQDRGYFIGETLPVIVRTDHARAELMMLLAINPDIQEPDREHLNDEALKMMAAFSTDHDYSDENEAELLALIASVPFTWPNQTSEPDRVA